VEPNLDEEVSGEDPFAPTSILLTHVESLIEPCCQALGLALLDAAANISTDLLHLDRIIGQIAQGVR